jgi:hypothetical protein
MNTTAAVTDSNGRELRKLSYVRIGESVDTATGIVSTVGGRARGYVTERWMRNHGWIY